MLKHTREFCATLPRTAATFTRRQLSRNGDFADETTVTSQTVTEEVILLAGSYPVQERGERKIRFANPNYVHKGSLETGLMDGETRVDTRKRVLHLFACARLGVLDIADIYERFGVRRPRYLTDFCTRHDIPWSRWRQEGRERIARTARLAFEWCGFETRELADLLGMKYSTLASWFSDWATPPVWETPTDPSGALRVGRTMG